MSLGMARGLTALYFVLMLVFTTWPGMLPFARVRPLILGFPFGFAWITFWIIGSVVVLVALDRVERRHRTHDGAAGGEGGR